MLRKPHWTLGLELAPHHFQFQDRYHEELISRRFEVLFDYAWGIHEIEWDIRAISAGQLLLRRLDAILPDGTPIECGGADGSPAPAITVRSLGGKDSLEVYVALRRIRAGANVDLDGDAKSVQRYAKETVLAADYASGTEPAAIEWLRPNVQLLLEGAPLQDFVALPCARVVRTASGELAFDEAFVPPVLSVRASSFLQTELRRLLEALVGRQAAIKRISTRDAGEAVQRWLSSAIGSFVPRVADLMNQRHAHPLVVYRVLAEMLGALAAFTRDGEYRVPAFDYDHLGPVFSDLFGSLTVVLDALGAQQHRRIPLQRYDLTTLFAELKEPAIFRNDFYLGVAGNDVETLRAHVPGHFKVAAWSELGVVVRTATAGVPLQLAARPPSTLPDGNGLVYFKLEKTGAFASIFKTGQLGIYHATGLAFTELALFAVDPSAT